MQSREYFQSGQNSNIIEIVTAVTPLPHQDLTSTDIFMKCVILFFILTFFSTNMTCINQWYLVHYCLSCYHSIISINSISCIVVVFAPIIVSLYYLPLITCTLTSYIVDKKIIFYVIVFY